MSLLFKWGGEGYVSHIYPDTSGRGDQNIKRMVRRSASEVAALPTGGANLEVVTAGPTNYSTEFDHWIKLSDYSSQKQRIEWRLTDTDGSIANPIAGGSTIDKYSIRFYFKMGALPIISQDTAVLISTADGNVDSDSTKYCWTYHLSQWDAVRSYRHWLRNAFTGSTVQQTGTAANNSAGTTAWRCEIQADGSRGGTKMFVRIYPADDTAISTTRTVSGSPTKVAIDRVYFGDQRTTGFQQITYLGQIEMHDDFTLGGQFGLDEAASDAALLGATGSDAAPVTRKTYEWFEWDGTDLVPLTVVGTKDGAGTADTADTEFTELEVRDVVPPAFTEYHYFPDLGDTDNSLTYLSGNKVGLIYPSGTAPTGGWPLWVWAHSGFFTNGSLRDMPREFINYLLANGFAVASVGYKLSQVVFSGGTYPAYPTASQYPHHIQDFKNAVTYLKSKGSSASGGDNTYPINGGKLIFSGYSAGGYIALAAAVSAGLADDGSGNDLRMTARSSTYQSVSGAPDPTCLGAYVWGAPVDMQYAADNDNTHPSWGFPSTIGGAINNGIVVAAAKAFVGRRLDQTLPDITYTGIPNLIAENSGNLPPAIGYYRGTSDFLVKDGHPAALEAALIAASYSGDYTYHEGAGVIHDKLDTQYDGHKLRQWYESLAGL